ncbi:unnamed protein product, partial [Effrenium voratum]
EALMLELDPAGLAEENRHLLQEKKQMLLELQRVARDNQRLAQSEALARAELEAFVCPSFWTGRAIDSRLAGCHLASQHSRLRTFGADPRARWAGRLCFCCFGCRVCELG